MSADTQQMAAAWQPYYDRKACGCGAARPHNPHNPKPAFGFPWFEAVGQNFVEYNYSDTEGSIGTMTDVSGIDDSDIEDVLDLPKPEP